MVADNFVRSTLSQPTVAKEDIFLHITLSPHESPADALTRHYNLSPRDIDAVAHNLMLTPEQKQKLPQRCSPIDLQHHIQTKLMRRVHLGTDIGMPEHHASDHCFLLSDSPFAFEIRKTKHAHSKDGDEKYHAGPGKYVFKKPIADLSKQPAHENERKSATWMGKLYPTSLTPLENAKG
ncbi:hypothetical protein BGX27_001292 [Mortierella sp. AM989]|nr:hypothetical protein BGX27_001292 [Mortierella sp. AM989]